MGATAGTISVCPSRTTPPGARGTFGPWANTLLGLALLGISGCCDMEGNLGSPGGTEGAERDGSAIDGARPPGLGGDGSAADGLGPDRDGSAADGLGPRPDGSGPGPDGSATDASQGNPRDGQPTGEAVCAEGYTCFADPDSEVVWVMKDDGNVNGPNCKRVCENALSQSSSFHACDEGRPIEHTDLPSVAPLAEGLGFSCREGGCWWPDAPAVGLILVSIATADDGSKTCFFPTESEHSCSSHPGNANCFGERYATICPCVPKALDEACEWECPPHHTTRAFWDTEGTSCVERINYWRRTACAEGWVECPPAGLPPMVECTACHACANSEAETDATEGSHSSFRRCGELVQGQGGGATCADVIDGFVAERAPDEHGVVRCRGHCGPIVAHGCQTFHWGRDRDSGFHTLNWRSCRTDVCDAYCDNNPGACFTHATSPSLTCQEPTAGE